MTKEIKQSEVRQEAPKVPKLSPQDITNILRNRLENPITSPLDLSEKDLSGIDLTTLCRRENKTDFHSAIFRGANLSGCDFTGISLQGCDFTGANREGAIFVDCDLQYAIGF